MPAGTYDYRALRMIATYAAVALLAVLPLACRKPPAAPPRIAPPVTVAKAISQDSPIYIDEIGNCTARDTVSIKPQATGTITDVHFIDGVNVKKGDLLFTIDPRPYQAVLDQAKATLAQSQAALALAKILVAHAEVLYPLKATSKEDLQTKQNAVETNQAQIQANQAAIETAEINLAYCNIHAPIDGLIGSRQVDIGNLVVANSDTIMLSIQGMDPMYANFTVTERELVDVRQAMAKGALNVYVRLPDEPDTTGRVGQLDFLNNVVQQGTGTVALRTTINNADRKFWPGQFIKVRLVLGIIKDAVLVPSQAPQTSQTGSYIYVLKPDSTAELRPVKVGQQIGDMVIILEGLQAGETVIVTGQLTVTPGSRVVVQTPATRPGATAPSSSTSTSAPASASTGKGGRP